eukprot:g18154.t1
MSLYASYLDEIETRKEQGLHPKPIDDGALTKEIIDQIKDADHPHRADSLQFFIYNTLPGTTSAAGEKAEFLKDIILGKSVVPEITPDFAFELLSHMKGGPSVRVLLDLLLGDDAAIAGQAADVLKTQVFLYEADTDRLKAAHAAGNPVVKDLLESYAKAEFFTKLPDVEDEIEVVTFIAAEGDISTDLLSPGNQAHSRADRELHGKCMIDEAAQKHIEELKLQHPGKRVMLIAEKGTMGVGSSRMSGVNNVALWTGKQASPYVPFVNIAPVVAGTNGISPIFLTTVGVTGGIGVDLKNWVKKVDADGKPILNNDGNPVLEQKYSAKASICISNDDTLIESLELAKHRIQIMIDKGMEQESGMLAGLIAIADKRIAEIRSGEKPALKPDANATYFAEVVVDLDAIVEPMIADPDVNNADVSKRYTHDTIRPISYYAAEKKVDLGFVGSCMVHKGDIKIVAQMLKNLEEVNGKVEFKAPLVVAAPTYNIVDELKEEGDWDILQKYSGFEFDDFNLKTQARTEYENILYLERPGCNLCMGNQEKAAKGDTVLATSTRLFQGRVVADSETKKGESLLASTPVVVLSAILGRTPTLSEYKTAVKGINLTKFAPPQQTPLDSRSVHF